MKINGIHDFCASYESILTQAGRHFKKPTDALFLFILSVFLKVSSVREGNRFSSLLAIPKFKKITLAQSKCGMSTF